MQLTASIKDCNAASSAAIWRLSKTALSRPGSKHPLELVQKNDYKKSFRTKEVEGTTKTYTLTGGGVQVALLRQGKASGRLVVLVQALTTPTLVAAAAAGSQPAGSFVQGTDVPAVIQVLHLLLHLLLHFPSLHSCPGIARKLLCCHCSSCEKPLQLCFEAKFFCRNATRQRPCRG